MKVLLGTVKENIDFTRMGKLKVSVGSIGDDDLYDVFYCSPDGGDCTHGFVSIPEIGTDILIIQPENFNKWFYIGSVFWNKQGLLSSDNFPLHTPFTDDPYGPFTEDEILPNKTIYDDNNIPTKKVWKTPLGNQVILSDQVNEEYNDSGSQIRSGLGKKLLLHDGLGVSVVKNEHGDGLTISSKSAPGYGQAFRGVDIDALGPIRLTSNEGSIIISLVDGLNIDIINKSTGSHRNPKKPKNFGNINIESIYGNLNLKVKSKDSKISLVAEGDNSDINIKSGARVKIESSKNINIDSGANINIKAAGNINIDGSKIHLNK